MPLAERQKDLLRIENLTLHYGAAQALFGIDLAVGQGEAVALVGANGAGKTSLLKAIMGLAPPSGGRIWLDGVDVTGSSPAAMAARQFASGPITLSRMPPSLLRSRAPVCQPSRCPRVSRRRRPANGYAPS